MHPFTGIIAFALALFLATSALMVSQCSAPQYTELPPSPQEMATARAADRREIEAIATRLQAQRQSEPPREAQSPAPPQMAAAANPADGKCGGIWNIECTFQQLNRALDPPRQSAPSPAPPAPARASVQTPGPSDCSRLQGTWRHPVAGTWTFQGNRASSMINSTNYGAAARQITELSISSCANGTLTYKIVRAALINTVDPSMAYDKTPANSPNRGNWSQIHNQAYSISGNSLKFGNYTYSR